MGKPIIQDYKFVETEKDEYFEENNEFEYVMTEDLKILALSPNFKSSDKIIRKIFLNEFISFCGDKTKVKEVILHDYHNSPVDSYYNVDINLLNFKRIGLNSNLIYQKFDKKFHEIVIYLVNSDCYDIKALSYIEKTNFKHITFFGTRYFPRGTTDKDFITLIEDNIKDKGFKNVSYYSSLKNTLINL